MVPRWVPFVRVDAPSLDARERTRQVWLGLITGVLGALIVIGFLEATDASRPLQRVGGAFSVEVGDDGVPYIAIDPAALDQNEKEPTTASRDGGGSKSGSSPILLFPLVGDLFTFGGDDPPPGTDPGPPPDPQPAPGPLPSPSPSPDPSPGPSPSPSPGPSPHPEPSPTPDPPPDPSPEPSPDPSPEPSPDPSPEPSPDPSPEPSPDPSPEPSPSPEPCWPPPQC
jgi:hypothetical protein